MTAPVGTVLAREGGSYRLLLDGREYVAILRGKAKRAGDRAIAGDIVTIDPATLTEETLAITGVDFANTFANVMIEQEKAKGVSAEALAQFTADMDQFRIQYANPLFRMPMTFAEIFPVGLLVSLISAALLRNSRFLAAKRS